MSSHVENQIQARIARARAEEERKRKERQELAPTFDPDNATLSASGA